MSIAVTERHSQIRDELLELILSEGFLALTIADLASRLHCSKTTLYALGSSKEQVTVNAVKHFFRQSTLAIEDRTAAADGSADKIVAYLRAVADGLRRASPEFIADVGALPPAREIYERNTAVAAHRVAELIDEGVNTGEFRQVHATFIADTVAAIMQRIQAGRVRDATGLSDAQAYDQLADLVLNGIRT